MRLRSLELSDFRKFDQPVRLEGLGDGINVLAEPNEFGKSTLLAAIKAVLFERHRAKGEVIQRLKHHRNATSPTVRMGFELADGVHRIEKRFLHKEPYARLTLPDGTRIEGDLAEERLQLLLGFGAPGKQGATADSVGLWGALWVEQQDAASQPALPDTGRAALHACLEAELGTLAGGDHSSAVRRAVDAEWSALMDGHGRPRGRHRQVAEDLAAAEVELTTLRGKRTSLEGAVRNLARLRRDLSQASNPGEDDSLAVDLDAARKRREAVLRHADRLKGAVATLQLAEQRHMDAAGERDRRSARTEGIASARQDLAAATNAEEQAGAALDAAEAALAAGRAELKAAEDGAGTAARNLRAAAAVSTFVLRSEATSRLVRQLDRADRAQQAVNKLTGELDAMPATAERLRAAEAAVAALDKARAALDAQATTVEFDLLPGADGRVRVAGSPVPPGQTALQAVTDTTIDIAGIGRVRIRPAIRDRDTLLRKVAGADEALRAALATAGAADPADARARAASRLGVEDRLRTAAAALAAEAPGDPAVPLAPGLEALRNHAAAALSRQEAEMAAMGLAAMTANAEAELALEEARRADGGTADRLTAARAALAGPQAARDRVADERARARALASAAGEGLARLRREADIAAADEGDAALEGRLARADVDRIAKQAVVADVQRDQPTDTLEGMEARISRLEQAARGRSENLRCLREEIAGIGAQVAHQEGDGLDEQIAAAERRRGDLAQEHARLERETAVLQLLRDALGAAAKEARERYMVPVLRRMTPYLQALFPGVEAALDENLRITGLTRQALGAEPIDRLSDGTREQVAVLLRLAYADLMREGGRPAMLILDDALAYSDRERLELMFDALTRAAERMQVLVLTCRVEAFGRLGGNRVRLVSA